MPGAQGPITVKGVQSDPNYVSRLLARSECLPGSPKIIVTSLITDCIQTSDMFVPRHRLGRRTFSVAGPAAWNSLLDYLRDSSADRYVPVAAFAGT